MADSHVFRLAEIYRILTSVTNKTLGEVDTNHVFDRTIANPKITGIAGDVIPLSARIMAVADVFDALTSRRCYKEPFSFEDDKYINLKFSNITPSFIWELHCIFEILDAHNTQMQRINNREYFYLTPYFYLFQPEKEIIFTIPDIDYTIDESFFNKWKEFVINAVKSWYYKENLKVICPYFFWIERDEKIIISDIESFNFYEFNQLISK